MALTYYLEIETHGLVVRAGVNDVPLLVDLAGEGLTMIRPINEWIRPADNRLTAVLLWPERTPFQAGVAAMRLHLRVSATGALEPSADLSLAELSWPPKATPEGYPAQLEQPFKVTTSPPTTLWGEAAKLSPPKDADRSQIVALVEEFRTTLVAKNFGRAFDLSRYRFEDEARSTGQQADEARAVALGQFRMLQKPAQVSSQPLAADDADLTLVANDQLLHVTRLPGGDEAIIFDTGRIRLKMDVFVGRVKDTWQIVR